MLSDKQKEILTEIVTTHLQVKKEKIVPNVTFDELGADSLDKIELVMVVEDEFGIEISDEDAEKLITIQDAINYLDKKL